MAENTMLSFYRNHAVAPVRLHVPDLDGHFARRRALYHQLAVGPMTFTGRRVLEVGPGTGQNALFVAAQRPAQMVLVEPNATGVAEIWKSFESFPEWRECLSVQNVDIESFPVEDPFDCVLCEGLVGASGHANPPALISAIAAHARPDGLLVMTCIEYVAFFSEMLRRLLAVEMAGHLADINDRTAVLLGVFSPHLARLRGMNRRHDDWIIDNLINPASIGRLVGLAECVACVEHDFEFLSSSPRFVADWKWYKEAYLTENFFNGIARHCYWRNLHNFMDYRQVHPPRSEAGNRSLSSRCEDIHHQIREYEESRDSAVRRQIAANLAALRDEVRDDLPLISASLAEVTFWLSAPTIDTQAVVQSTSFGPWFGRGATYVSFVRRP